MLPYAPLGMLALSAVKLPLFASAVTYEVTVGAGGEFVFDPEWVNAVAGDFVNFTFNPKNHTVTQSTFDAPCVPLAGGEDSGFVPVTADTTPLPTFQVAITDASSMWFFCNQGNHCGTGMVFAINPAPEGEDRSFSAFRDLAIQINGTGAAPSTTTSAPQSSETYVTPPPQSWEMATDIITHPQGSVWTTTYTSYEGTPEPTFAAQPGEHRITVGEGGELRFRPENITASIGDTVIFEFRPKNHTVTQSSFSNPCVRLTRESGELGFDSGFQFVAENATEFPEFRIVINDTAPIWGYCAQGNHCGAGMVFSINAVESGPNNFSAFRTLAERINGSSSGTGEPTSGPDNGGDNSAMGGRPTTVMGWICMAAVGVLGFGQWF